VVVVISFFLLVAVVQGWWIIGRRQLVEAALVDVPPPLGAFEASGLDVADQSVVIVDFRGTQTVAVFLLHPQQAGKSLLEHDFPERRRLRLLDGQTDQVAVSTAHAIVAGVVKATGLDLAEVLPRLLASVASLSGGIQTIPSEWEDRYTSSSRIFLVNRLLR
jgi:hypothetical protein